MPSERIDLTLEPCFLLVYYGGLTWSEARAMPIQERNWFIKRLQKELTDDKGQAKQGQQLKALHQNDPQTRALQGNNRAQMPSRLRRPT
jgi:hypothetical protein